MRLFILIDGRVREITNISVEERCDGTYSKDTYWRIHIYEYLDPRVRFKMIVINDKCKIVELVKDCCLGACEDVLILDVYFDYLIRLTDDYDKHQKLIDRYLKLSRLQM